MTLEWEVKHIERKNDEIRISTDAMIALVVTEAEERELAKMPSLGEMNAAFQPTDQFQKKMEKLLRTAKSKRRRRQWLRMAKRTAVCFAVLITLFTCMMMSAKAVQKAVVTTLIEWHDKFMSVVFSSEEFNEQMLPETIEFGFIPDGFALEDSIVRNEYSFLASYASEYDFIAIHIFSMEKQGKVSADNEHTIFYSLHFNDCEAIWGVSEDGMNILIWNKDNFVYQILGTVDLKTLIQVAENIKI